MSLSGARIGPVGHRLLVGQQGGPQVVRLPGHLGVVQEPLLPGRPVERHADQGVRLPLERRERVGVIGVAVLESASAASLAACSPSPASSTTLMSSAAFWAASAWASRAWKRSISVLTKSVSWAAWASLSAARASASFFSAISRKAFEMAASYFSGPVGGVSVGRTGSVSGSVLVSSGVGPEWVGVRVGRGRAAGEWLGLARRRVVAGGLGLAAGGAACPQPVKTTVVVRNARATPRKRRCIERLPDADRPGRSSGWADARGTG